MEIFSLLSPALMEEQLLCRCWGDDGRSHLWLSVGLVVCVTLPDWFQTVVSAPLLSLWEQSWPAFKGLAHVLPLRAEGDVGF